MIEYIKLNDIKKLTYLFSVKNPNTMYLHEWSGEVDKYKEDDGKCICNMNTILHCFCSKDLVIYFLNSKGNIVLKTFVNDSLEFYIEWGSHIQEFKLKEPTIKKFINNIKDWYEEE